MTVLLVSMIDIKMQESLAQMHLSQFMPMALDWHLLKVLRSLYGRKNPLAVLQGIFQIKKEKEYKLK